MSINLAPRVRRTLAALAFASAAAQVAAITVAGPGAAAEQGRRSAPPPSAGGAAVTGLPLSSGVLEAVDAAHHRITVRGTTVLLHPSALRVFGPGGAALSGAQALRPGMTLRFALEPASPASAADSVRRIVLIYIDR
jgi:hypothetical protein